MSWSKKFKGNVRGGAWIHIHPDCDRGIIENQYGFIFLGVTYGSLSAAKQAAEKYMTSPT